MDIMLWESLSLRDSFCERAASPRVVSDVR
jgi:hypothetical protein